VLDPVKFRKRTEALPVFVQVREISEVVPDYVQGRERFKAVLYCGQLENHLRLGMILYEYKVEADLKL
jgi:hypothetical protein